MSVVAELCEFGIGVWSALTLAIYGAVVVWCLVHSDWRMCLDIGWPGALIRRAFTWCRTAFSKHRSDWSPLESAANKLFQARRAEFVRRGTCCMSPMMACGLCWICSNAGPWIPGESPAALVESHALFLGLVLAMFAWCTVRADQPVGKVLVLAHIIGFGDLLLACHRHKNGIELIFDRPASLAIRFVFAMTHCDVRLSFALNSFFSAFITYKFQSFASTDKDLALLGFQWFVVQECSAVLGVVVVQVVMRWRMEMEARLTVEAKLSLHFLSGLRKLLRTNYDVVVELANDLSLSEHSEDLAGVLLYGAHRSLKGSFLTDLMAYDVDREAFSAHVTEPRLASESQCSAIPHVFHMRDSDSNIFRMEMWHARFEDLEARTRHLIAIKERANDEQVVSPQAISSHANSMRLHREGTSSSTRPHGGGSKGTGKGNRGTERSSSEGRGALSGGVEPREGYIAGQGVEQLAPQEGPQLQDQAELNSDGEDSDAASVSSTPSRQSVSSTPSRRARRCIVEGMKRTSPQAQRTSLLLACSQWNFAIRPAGCCTYHALIEEAASTVKCLRRADCNDLQLRNVNVQCSRCGILEPTHYDPVTRNCLLCRNAGAPEPTRIGL